MPVKYIKKGGKIVGEVWQGKKKMDTGTMVALGGVSALAIIGVVYVWWQMNKPAAGLQTRSASIPCHRCNPTIASCHRCGGT